MLFFEALDETASLGTVEVVEDPGGGDDRVASRGGFLDEVADRIDGCVRAFARTAGGQTLTFRGPEADPLVRLARVIEKSRVHSRKRVAELKKVAAKAKSAFPGLEREIGLISAAERKGRKVSDQRFGKFYSEAEGLAKEIEVVAVATAEGIRKIASAIEQPGGSDAVNLRVAEQYIKEFGNLAKAANTLIVPANLSDVASMIALATKVFEHRGADPASGQS